MRRGDAVFLVVGGIVLSANVGPGGHAATAPEIRANPNSRSAGTLTDGVLHVKLEAEKGLWRFAAGHAPMTVEAFAERGEAPSMPGPLLRVPAGTEIQLELHNSLATPVTFDVPAAMHGGADRLDAMDSIIVAPGADAMLTTRADVPGNYIYRGLVPDGVTKVSHIAGALAGAIVVDSAGASRKPRDRVFVIMATEDSASAVCDDTAHVNPLSECHARRFMYTINGTQWPNTDRVHATVGDSLHWRVINASFQVHPMHLHGFFFRVDQVTGPLLALLGAPAPGQMVVTQLLASLSSMSMTWSPERAGNWLFHCHFALHNSSYSMLATPMDPDMRDMVGLIIGINVAPRPGAAVAAKRVGSERQLRLIAEQGPGESRPGITAVPSMQFVLDDHGRRTDTHTDLSPELDLVRGVPVAITIVNHLTEPTTVHWHGMEVQDSYSDGVAGFSGQGKHLAPEIAPGDSFVARFTPTRSGTYMYHAHMDEMREELAGLAGALIVRDSGRADDDHIVFFKGDLGNRAHPVEINGRAIPDTIVLHVGRPTRLRLMNLSTNVATAAPAFWLTARQDSVASIASDSMLVRWVPLAKDAFDLPVSARTPRLAQQVVSVGETYDFQYTPSQPGMLWLELRALGGQHALFIRVPVRVE